MHSKPIFGAVCLLMLTAGTQDVQRYSLDTSASAVSAKVAFFGIASKTAGFPKVTGNATIADRDPESLELDVRIDARALTAPDKVTLGRLKGEKFFWVEKYPEIRFSGTGLKMSDGRSGSLKGNLTARGVSRPVTLAVTFDQDPSSTSTDRPIVIVGTTRIDRRDFEMTSYGLIVGKQVDITIRARMVPK